MIACQLVTCDDADICTRDFCLAGQCRHETICDSRQSGERSFTQRRVLIDLLTTPLAECRSISSCDDCEATDGCTWLQCSKDYSLDLSNVTSLLINNHTKLNAFYTRSPVPILEKYADGKSGLAVHYSNYRSLNRLDSVVQVEQVESIFRHPRGFHRFGFYPGSVHWLSIPGLDIFCC